MEKKATTQNAEMGKRVSGLADELNPNTSPFTAGSAIEQGIKGEGGFISRFRDTQRKLYDELDKHVKPSDKITTSNTMDKLAELSRDIEGAEKTSSILNSSAVKDIKEAFTYDQGAKPDTESLILSSSGRPIIHPGEEGSGAMPYEAIKRIRSKIGEKLSDTSLTDPVSKSEWKQLYGALSKDMENAVSDNPEAMGALKRANRYTQEGHDKIDNILNKIISNKIPEDIYKSATSMSDIKSGATKIQTVMESLNEDEQNVVRAQFLKTLGLATPGAQTAEGDVFSPHTFLTNWNKISPEAKNTLFPDITKSHSAVMSDEIGAGTRKSLDKIAKATSNIKEGSKVFANASNTARAGGQLALVSGVAGAAASGNYKTALGLIGGAGAANLSARLMTNPRFVNWLAKATTKPGNLTPALLYSLEQHIQNEPDDVKKDARKYMQALQQGNK